MRLYRCHHKASKTLVLPSLIDDTTDLAVIHRGCNDLGFKNKEALSTAKIVNTILEIGKLRQTHGVKDIFISSLICTKNNFQNYKVIMINNLLRSVRDSLGFHFIDSSSVTTWLVMEYI